MEFPLAFRYACFVVVYGHSMITIYVCIYGNRNHSGDVLVDKLICVTLFRTVVMLFEY